MHQFAQLLEGQFDSAACGERPYRNTLWRLDNAWRYRVRDAPPLEQTDEVRTTRSRRIPDAARAQDCIAKRRFVTDVGPWRPGGHGYRHPGMSEIDWTARIDAAVGCQLPDRIGRQYDEVETFTCSHATGRINSTHAGEDDRLPGPLLVGFGQLGKHLAHRHRGDARHGFDFACLAGHFLLLVNRCISIRPFAAARACCTCPGPARLRPASRACRFRRLRALPQSRASSAPALLA